MVFLFFLTAATSTRILKKEETIASKVDVLSYAM